MTIYKLLTQIIKAITHSDVNIEEHSGYSITSYKITAPRTEYGKICGARGKMIQAIKHIFEYSLSRAINEPLKVSLYEPQDGFMGHRHEEPDPNKYDPEKVTDLALDLLSFFNKVSSSWDRDDVGFYNYKFKVSHQLIDEHFIDAFNVLFNGVSKAQGCPATYEFDLNG